MASPSDARQVFDLPDDNLDIETGLRPLLKKQFAPQVTDLRRIEVAKPSLSIVIANSRLATSSQPRDTKQNRPATEVAGRFYFINEAGHKPDREGGFTPSPY